MRNLSTKFFIILLGLIALDHGSFFLRRLRRRRSVGPRSFAVAAEHVCFDPRGLRLLLGYDALSGFFNFCLVLFGARYVLEWHRARPRRLGRRLVRGCCCIGGGLGRMRFLLQLSSALLCARRRVVDHRFGLRLGCDSSSSAASRTAGWRCTRLLLCSL